MTDEEFLEYGQENWYKTMDEAFHKVFDVHIDKERFDRTWEFSQLTHEFEARWPDIPEYINIKLWGLLTAEQQIEAIKLIREELDESLQN